MKFFIFHKNGQTLAEGVNESTTRKILRNFGPVACMVYHYENRWEGLNGVEWIIANPGTR